MKALFAWIGANIWTIIICAVLVALMALIIVYIIREKKKGRCDSLISENSVHRMYSGYEGKRAITDYEVIREAGEFSLVRLKLLTGRKNQIRVHMKELGNPVVGDKKYGSETNPIGRLGLHASALSFIHPVTGKEIKINARHERKFALPK